MYLQSGTTALFVASHNGHREIVHVLIEKGADVNICMKVQRAFRVRITGVLSMEVEEDGVGYSSLEVGNNHAGPSGHA